jgi:Zn finger protein HypA/HybF involved in hydrogenase expression
MREPEYWCCDDCNETWTIIRGRDRWNGECPSCGKPMQRVDESWLPDGR